MESRGWRAVGVSPAWHVVMRWAGVVRQEVRCQCLAGFYDRWVAEAASLNKMGKDRMDDGSMRPGDGWVGTERDWRNESSSALVKRRRGRVWGNGVVLAAPSYE